MGDFSYSDLMALDLTKLGTAASDWRTMAGELAKLTTDVHDGLTKKSDGARWKGVNATVTKDFVRKTAKEFTDLQTEAESIAGVLTDAHAELTRYQKQAQSLTDSARKGDPNHNPPDPGLLVFDGPGGTVRVTETMCTPEGPDQRTKDRMQWYADTLTGIVQHAAEVDAAAVRALRKSHGNDPYNAGHARYTSLDEEQLPRAKELAGLGGDANPQQRAELRRLWESLSPEARAQLWLSQKDDLMAAGILSPTMPQIAPDAGSGRHASESPGFDEWVTKQKMELLTEGADWKGMTDASRHMAHYLGNSGSPMNLPVDKMMTDVPAFKTYVDDIVRLNQDDWRKQALDEFRKNGGKPVAFPIEAKQPEGFYFTQQADPNWFYAVGGANTNVTGVVTAVPDANGNPRISIDYQANVWDRYNWDEGKGVNVGPLDIPDGEMAKLHRVGLAQEFDMSGSSSVNHYDLGSSEPNDDPLPGPDESRDGRLNPGREQQQDRTTDRAAGRADGR
ncbi:hypothetical protein [Streptomyces ipomoeae]|uniref:hypothetical protein n=1 Tax=Streptomyces ipomoeae TaxID=103232 RepID=UPI0011464C04|nr:hypothetical protein [Streptomyces ipomoeae]MDX2938167.1 hypothetical protein [Streptomyces ipomoeae]TQE27019.1 hypothetical protein SipoB123_12600 [Streptomyces ipomoeae]